MLRADAKSLLRARARRLLARHGVPFDLDQSAQWYDGHRIAAGDGAPAVHILHEAAHWLLSTAADRRRVNFGLGIGPDPAPFGTACPEAARRLGLDPSHEEAMASGAGIVLVAMLRGPYAATLRDHCWGESGSEKEEIADLKQCVDRLRSAGVRVPATALAKVRRSLRRLVRESIRQAERLP